MGVEFGDRSSDNCGMKIYLVGGAVRDELLNRPVTERDWVVVGSSPEEMKSLGYQQVGKDFPVFLHPQTKEEYALARTVRKTAAGYYGFEVDAGKAVTLEEDLLRRDLTVNAMAKDDEGKIIDPHGGQKDLQQGILRHVSPAFAEDPVRILRIARFAARYHHLGFRVADETVELMQGMVNAGEVDALVPERVWQELERSLGEKSPGIFIQQLRDCNALAVLFPEIDRLFGVPQRGDYHPEIDTGIHTLMALEQTMKLTLQPVALFAAICHDLGKGTTSKDILPSHHGHEERGVRLVKKLCQRCRAPREYLELAQISAKYHTHCHRAFELKPSTLLETLTRLDGLRKPERFEAFLQVCEGDSRGRTGFENKAYPQADYFRGALAEIKQVNPAELAQKGLSGKQMGEALTRLRVERLTEFKQKNALPHNHQ